MSLVNTCERIAASGCSLCPDLVGARSKIVISRGNPNADVVIVGQNPGANEDSIGKPFMGPAGQLLDDMLKAAGYNPNEDFFFTNVVLCHSENNAAPVLKHMRNCSTHTEQILGGFKKYVAIGRVAAIGLSNLYAPELLTKFQVDTMGKTKTNGMPYSMRDDRKLFVTYHTSFLLRSGLSAHSCDNKLYKDVISQIEAAKTHQDYSPNVEKTLNASLF